MESLTKRIITILLIAVIGIGISIIAWVFITPPQRVKSPDVTDRGEAYSGFSPTAVKPGSTNFNIWCDIENLGGSSTGDFNVYYYASINTNITIDDYLIGIDTVSSISSLDYGDSQWSGIFPSSGIPDGVYFIGWIIDRDDYMSELNETNNIAYVSSHQLIVDSINPSSSISYTVESLPNIISNTTSFTLSADDIAGSGINNITYKIDDGIWTLYTGSFTLDSYAKRNHTIYYFSTDNAGNEETMNSEIVNLDIPYLYPSVLFAPGAPVDTPEDRIIKIGTLADLTHISGEGTFQGSYSAIKQINEAGGISITQSTDETFPNGTYYFGIIGENTYEAEPILDVSKAVLAAERLLTIDDPDFVIGGFRTEATMAVEDYICNAEKIFMITGADADGLLTKVSTNYSSYKYLFRTMPTNASSSAKEIVEFYALVLKPAMEAALGVSVDKVAIIRENLPWALPMSYVLQGYYAPYGYWGLNNNPWFNFTIVYEIAYPITATPADFTTYMNQLQTSGAQIVFPLISMQGGILLMTQYNNLQPDYIIAGIDHMSQFGDYWYDTDGNCAYEIIMQSTTRTNKTSLTIPMWDAYAYLWGKDPFYPAIGSYDSVYMLLDAINKVQSIDSDDIIAQLETINIINPFEGAGGNIAFNFMHDLIEGYDPISEIIYSTYLWKQWQSGGTQSIVTSAGYIYPEWIVDSAIQIPPWM
ncbi:MAG: ABC transporter substrate-binding protein [Promethearchaeota archaeon]